MEKKIIYYGTEHQVKVLSATENVITVVDENGEGYVLLGHGTELPKVGDVGKITFIKSNTPMNGHWHYESINSEMFRPKTRGELVEKLKQGIKCEVVASNEEITSLCLNGWLNFEGKYKTYPSENAGWVIYEAI